MGSSRRAIKTSLACIGCSRSLTLANLRFWSSRTIICSSSFFNLASVVTFSSCNFCLVLSSSSSCSSSSFTTPTEKQGICQCCSLGNKTSTVMILELWVFLYPSLQGNINAFQKWLLSWLDATYGILVNKFYNRINSIIFQRIKLLFSKHLVQRFVQLFDK